jgi:GNAT superfamily N-acetyltransferase
MAAIRIVDVTDEASFALIPACADPRFDHRTCDYWEDADRGSKASRPAWVKSLDTSGQAASAKPNLADNPFAPVERRDFNPFAPADERPRFADPFGDEDQAAVANPFAPQRQARPTVAREAPRKLQMLGRGLAVFGSYAKTMLVDDEPVGYVQFGPLSAYPRALRLRELYPQLPEAPLPAVITCIATAAEARRLGYAIRLVDAVCEDLAARGFAAVEAYPEVGADPDATSAATPEFWLRARFTLAIDDERFPVLRRELD